MKQRSTLQFLLLSLKGMAMGAADVVPGVSGGTIAFISGIYEELIESINKINLGALKVLRKEGVKAAWKHINGTFFVFLFVGIFVSILSLAKLMTGLLETHPVLVWSFFFGLILASIWLVSKSVKQWSIGAIAALVFGGGLAYYITTIQSVANVDAEWFIFLSGALAICAMILPGISGAFILLLLGSYNKILEAISDKELVTLGIFAVGCLVGLLSFARILKYLFSKFKNITIALLTGFMVGSLNKVWPWKLPVGDAPLHVHSDGREDWLMENVLPADFAGGPHVGIAIACAVGGLLLIVLLERFGPKES